MNKLDQKTVTFLLADDHSLIRQGLLFLLEEISPDSQVLQASSLQQVLETLKINKIDIAIIDAHFPDGNSLAILPEIKKIRPEIKILIFTGIDEHTQSLKFINAGAHGFLSKMSEEEEIENAIRKMLQHGEYISQATQSLLLSSLRDPKAANPLLSLTERELQVAELYAKGLGNLEIANQLDVKQNTISTIKKRLFDKLNIQNIVELIELIKNRQ
ncbi:MAG: DNA-binding response regulator [Chryseobacterium sp.]|jgi:DNA-binding NarL/FixJ family response regulator|nr:DNA-binding response regulator [Chryseobacterium sp.]